MKKTYLIDSENINDVWVEILDALEREDCIMVFFTDKSAHMGYDRIVRLMNQEKGTVKWIRCFGGQNALDFQLVTELGHQICQDQEREYVIVSNDTGYDAAVRYWQQRGCSVSRIKGVECTKLALRVKKQRQAEKNREARETRQIEETPLPEVRDEKISERSGKNEIETEMRKTESAEKEPVKNEEAEKVRTDGKPAGQRLDDVLNGRITDKKVVEEEVEKAIELLFDPAFLDEDSSENCEENEEPELEQDLPFGDVDDEKDDDDILCAYTKSEQKKSSGEPIESQTSAQASPKKKQEKASQKVSKEADRKKKKKAKSSAVLAKTLFDKVATPERKAQMESLTDTAKTALGAVLESASEIIAEQIAEKAVSKNSKNSRSVKGETVCKSPETEKPEKEGQEEEDPEGYPELEDERDLNYDPDEDPDMDINMDAEIDAEADSEMERKPDQDLEQKVSEPEIHEVSEIQEETPKQKNVETEKQVQKERTSLKTEIPAPAKEKDHANERTEEEEAQRMASYSSCQRAILRIFRASGSADPHADLRFFMEICRTIKLSNMPLVHNALEYQFGQAVGNSLYRYLKENTESREELSAGYNNNKKQREREYLNLTLKRNHEDIQEETMEAIWKILSTLPRKNLSGIHTALVKKFGQKDGSSYYAGIRNHVRIIRGL